MFANSHALLLDFMVLCVERETFLAECGKIARKLGRGTLEFAPPQLETLLLSRMFLPRNRQIGFLRF